MAWMPAYIAVPNQLSMISMDITQGILSQHPEPSKYVLVQYSYCMMVGGSDLYLSMVA
jgi:hypothetical protein